MVTRLSDSIYSSPSSIRFTKAERWVPTILESISRTPGATRVRYTLTPQSRLASIHDRHQSSKPSHPHAHPTSPRANDLMPPNGSSLTITNPLVLYRSLIATNRIQPDPAQHRLGT